MLSKQIPYQDPLKLFAPFANQAFAMWLDSSSVNERTGRFSFIALDPFETLVSKDNKQDSSFTQLQNVLNQFKVTPDPSLPPFQGGALGCLSYDLCHQLETLPKPAHDDMQFNDIAVGLYDIVIAFDHLQEKTWIISTGFPETNNKLRQQRAKQRLHWLEEQLKAVTDLSAPSSITCKPADITSNFTQDDYETAVQRVIDYIFAGDIFEANISQRFMAQLPEGLSEFDLYRRLRTINKAPFSAYLNCGDEIIASASPERFLLLNNQHVVTRPIKGTAPRGKDVQEDVRLGEALLASEKDNAENVMIVDLMRNDLSKVCEAGSISVPELCILESFASVHHLVSTVNGKLREGYDALDLLQATFPGGSITGAPKIRTMEIIAELESTRRGPYCGSIGYIGFDGNMDTSIVIRTYGIKNKKVTFQAGGAIVADSNPRAEYLETLDKARLLQRALTEAG